MPRIGCDAFVIATVGLKQLDGFILGLISTTQSFTCKCGALCVIIRFIDYNHRYLTGGGAKVKLARFPWAVAVLERADCFSRSCQPFLIRLYTVKVRRESCRKLFPARSRHGISLINRSPRAGSSPFIIYAGRCTELGNPDNVSRYKCPFIIIGSMVVTRGYDHFLLLRIHPAEEACPPVLPTRSAPYECTQQQRSINLVLHLYLVFNSNQILRYASLSSPTPLSRHFLREQGCHSEASTYMYNWWISA